MENNFEIDKVRSLSDKEQAIEKLPVFFGSRKEVYHPFKEVLNNALDEIITFFKKGEVQITLSDDNKFISIEDSGRGLPIMLDSPDGGQLYKNFFLTLFSGGKYDANNPTSGTNGVGLTVINYNSIKCEVTSYFRGEEWFLSFKDNGTIDTPLTKVGTTDKHGTKISFQLDQNSFSESIDMDINKIIDYTDKSLMSYPTISANISYKGEIKHIQHNDFEEYFLQKSELNKSFVANKKDFEHDSISAVFYHSREDVYHQTNLNGIYLIEGEDSSIDAGFLDGIRNFTNNYCKLKGLFGKKEKNISRDDIKGTISYCINFFSRDVEYVGQTKFKTEKPIYQKIAKEFITSHLEVFSIERKAEFEEFVNQILLSKRANEKAENSRKMLKKKLEEKVAFNNRPDGLIECREKDFKKRILCICEGKSALGSLVSGRRDCHALYALRGKVLNLLKASDSKILSNDVITDLYRALGCGVEMRNKKLGNFNIDNLRYSKVYIYTDLDFDGIGSIAPLLITMFYRLSPDLIKKGMVYVVLTPKYEISLPNDKFEYATNDEELEAIKNKYPNTKLKVHYIKGLAELSAEAMAMTLKEDYENIIQLTMKDIEKCKEMLEIFMGDNVKIRKEYILKEY